ncbi:MAG: type II toxin-antitoxin system HicB family antitoxin [Candidatus Vogelbacteria bacterium]|nr:type II toxin-antitoxin system HicB family antitoxin [Candidatus Vogelbacteria bacterium]
MKNIIQFHISKGEKYYVAEGVDVAIVTQGKTLDELALNIKEAVELHFEDENAKSLGFTNSPSVLLNFELPQLSYA